MKIYIATSLKKATDHNHVRDALQQHGISLTYDWSTHGSVKSTNTQRLNEVATNELSGIARADALVVLLPGGHGTHTELGFALGSGIPVILHATDARFFTPGPDTCAFYHYDGIEHVVCGYEDMGPLVEKLKHVHTKNALASV